MTFASLLALVGAVAAQLADAAACCSASPQTGTAAFAAALVYALVFGGVFVDPTGFAPSILQYGSFLMLGFEAQLTTELKGRSFVFDVSDVEVAAVPGETWLA